VVREASGGVIATMDAQNLVSDEVEDDDIVGVLEHEDVWERTVESNEITFKVFRRRLG
jgi:hypothetical protein